MATPDIVLKIATAEIGTKEVSGNKSNPRIVEYHKATSLKAGSDEVPWCSAFVNWCLSQAGIEGTHNAMARSFLRWGAPLDEPVPGCVIIMRRGNPPFGHVGFYVRKMAGGFVKVLGGNQSDQVRVSTYKEADVIGYRWIEKTTREGGHGENG
jgi:uncharacterized protein (TIGR02594 family)